MKMSVLKWANDIRMKTDFLIKTARLIQKSLLFLIFFAFNFILIFVLLNFAAVKEILYPYIFVKSNSEKVEAITKSIGEWNKDQLITATPTKRMLKKDYPVFELDIIPLDTRLVIPKLGINVPIISMPLSSLNVTRWSEFETIIQGELKRWVVQYPWTASPGQIWNVFITGHSSYYPWDDWRYKDVFARLSLLSPGDEYFVFYRQEKYKYRVFEKKEVQPSNIDILNQPDDKRISTLMTCTPLGTNLRRLVILSELEKG